MNKPDTQTDHMSREGAYALAEQLDAYWREQGATTVQHWVELASVRGRKHKRDDGNDTDQHDTRSTIWVVRSNLINGLPPRAA